MQQEEDHAEALLPSDKLLRAAKLVEDTAYELAGDVEPGVVSGLMLKAAELERMAQIDAVQAYDEHRVSPRVRLA